jgi:hypothetical protein
MKLIALPLLLGALASALGASEPTVSSIAFSDPAKPGEVRIHLGQGRVVVRGTDEREVTVSSSLAPKNKETQRKDGLRVISTAAGFSLTESGNVIELSAGLDGPGAGVPAQFEVRVPRSSEVSVSNSWGGDIVIENVDGDVEIKNLNGEIRLVGLAGGALVETMNGRIEATYTALPATKPVSFTSMNGDIQLNLHAQAGANVRFRTQNGNVLTDFEEDALVTKSEPVTPTAMQEMAQAAGEAARAAGEAARAAAAAAREQVEKLKQEMAERRAQGLPEKPEGAAAPKAPKPPKPPRPPSIPALAGGKVVQGTLNGGGPEIQIATMNGDIILRKQAP